MTPFDRHLRAAIGFLELGMPLDANEEIDSIPPELKTLSGVLAVRVEIFRAVGNWDLMEIVARQLCDQRPDDPACFISLGYAIRRGRLAGGAGCARHGRTPVPGVRHDQSG